MTVKKIINHRTDGNYDVIKYIWDVECDQPIDILDFEIVPTREEAEAIK